MSLEVDAARDASADLAALLPFPSSPEEERDARAAVLEAYMGPQGAAEASARHASPPFPGPNPISMDLDTHLPAVQREAYSVSAKVDGTRFQLVAMADGAGNAAVVLVDRTMRCFSPTYFRFEPALFSGAGRVRAVLDAELAEVLGRGPELFVFDAAVLGGSRSVGALPYSRRCAALSAAVAGGELGFGGGCLVPVRAKPIFPKALAAELMRHPERFIGAGIATDGVVLTPEADPVRAFRHWRMFKVKEKHTLDLRLVLVPKQPLRAFTNPILAMPDSIVQRMRSNVFAGGARAKPASMGAAPAPTSHHAAAAAAAPAAAPASLLHLLGSRKRARPQGAAPAEPPSAPAAAPPRQPLQPPSAPAAAPPRQPNQTLPVSQWIIRLEYVCGGRVLDATTDGVEYAGHRVIFAVRETPALCALIDGVERVWREMPGDVMTMSLIAEVALTLSPEDLETRSYDLVNPVTVERARPDKQEPNSFVTITRTFTSILYGVRPEHLARLAEAAEET
jgi:hypothetical protein